MQISKLLPFVGLCMFAGAMMAQDGPGKCPPYPDGRKPDATPIVNAIDTNHDGKMTKAEWDAAGAPEASWNMFMNKYPEAKKAGYITREQFLAEAPPNGIDTACKGYITIDDFRATKKWKMGGPPAGGAPGGAPGGASGAAPGSAPNQGPPAQGAPAK